MTLNVHVPKELLFDPFPINKQFPYLMHKDFVSSQPFIHEAHFYLNMDALRPWDKENLQFCVSEIFEEWKQLKPKIEGFIKEREKQNLSNSILLGMEFFLESVFWINEQPVCLDNGLKLESLEIKPFNLEDRLLFIIKRMDGYHSYRQLDELFKELEKQFSVKLLRLKRDR